MAIYTKNVIENSTSFPYLPSSPSPLSCSLGNVTSTTHPHSPLSPSCVHYIPDGAALLAFLCALAISLIGILGNAVTVAALVKYAARLNSHATTRFVITLAISDLLFSSIVLPLNGGRFLTRRWPFGDFLCKLYPVIYYGSVATSLMLITMITINRLILIAFNSLYRRLYTDRKVALMIVFCYVFSYGCLLIPFFNLYGSTGLNAATFSCTILRDSANRSMKKFLFTLGFLLPMTVIIVCYSIIFAHVQKQNRKGARIRASKRDLRLTLLISVVFGTFMLCFLPLFIGNVLITDDRYPYFHVLASICAWLNAAINPFIYFAMNPRYRNAFKKLFRIKSSYAVNSGSNGGAASGGGGVGGGGELSNVSENGAPRSVKWTSSKKTVVLCNSTSTTTTTT